MKERRRILLLLTLLALGGVVFRSLVLPSREPVYQGKPLRVWVQNRLRAGTDSELNAVIQELDEQGIKQLGRFVSHKSLTQRKFYARLYGRLPGRVQACFGSQT